MKTVIKLIPEQIEQLIQVEKALLTEEKEKAIKRAETAFKNEVKVIEKKFQTSVEKLQKKYENFEINIGEEISKPEPNKTSNEQIKVLFEEGKTVKEIAEATGKTDSQIRQKLFRMGLKVKNRTS